MTTLEFATARTFKTFVKENRKYITNINGVEFRPSYPMIEATRKHTSYYDVNTGENTLLHYPLTVVFDEVAKEESECSEPIKNLINWQQLSIIIAGNSESIRRNRIPAKYLQQVHIFINALNQANDDLRAYEISNQ